MNIFRFVLLSFFTFLFAAFLSSCSSTPKGQDQEEEVVISVDDKAQTEEERAERLEQFKTEKACCVKLMTHASTEQALSKFKKEIDRLNAEIARLETDVPKDITKAQEIEISVSKETADLINEKKARLARIQIERKFLAGALEKSETLDEIKTVKDMIDHLDGEEQNLSGEITSLEHEAVNQDKFVVQKMVVYGPLGWAVKLLEIILDRLYIMFVW